MIAVTPKIPLDIDGYACTYAYAEYLEALGKDAKGVVFGEPHREVKYLLEEFRIPLLSGDLEIIKKAEEIILVDSSSLQGIPRELDPKKVIEVVDHRKSPNVKELFPNAKIQIERIGAAATLITEKFKQQTVPISREAVTLLYVAIGLHTHKFKTQVTGERDKQAYTWLEKAADLPKGLIHQVLLFKSKYDDDTFAETILSDISSDVKESEINGKRVGIAQLEVINLKKMVNERKEQILEVLKKIKEDRQFEYIFLTAVDLEEEFNLFVTDHPPTKRLLEESLGIEFGKSLVARREGILLRKEIIPMLIL